MAVAGFLPGGMVIGTVSEGFCNYLMYNNSALGTMFLFFSFLVLAMSALASPSVPVSLPPVTHADTETTTNVAFAAGIPYPGKFALALECLATPSNNVQVAFGTDKNANGVLDLEETELLTGWDCGAWFVQQGYDAARLTASATPANDMGSLSWNIRLSSSGVPLTAAFNANGVPLFADVAAAHPSWLYSRSWNMLRLTGRGLAASNESFEVSILPDGFTIILR